MRIELDELGPAVLAEPDDFTGFKIVGDPELVADPDRLALAVGSFGRLADPTHVYVDVDALIRLAGEQAMDETWLESLQGMVGYADKHGWLDASGAIRAHVEPVRDTR